MTKVFIVAATHFEIAPFLKHLGLDVDTTKNAIHHKNNALELKVLITGVGMVETTYYLAQEKLNDFDLILNLGVAGTFDTSAELGSLFNITQDCIAELGAENKDLFIPIVHMELPSHSFFINKSATSYPAITQLKTSKAITVNKVHGNEKSIADAKMLFGNVLESMEGAAFMRCCMHHPNYFQIRAVSNYVEPRNKANWKMKEAIENLNLWTINFIENISSNE